MAKGKYERKILNSHVENFQEQMERSYSQYQEGSYVPVTFYQLDREKSRVDGSLDVAQNIIGNSSSRKYKKIEGVPLYGLASGINFETELSESSFKNISGGSAYFAPGTVKPTADDFFTIDRQGFKNHLFKITNTDFNTANVNKYYQVTFELFQNSPAEIVNNINGEYVFVIDNMGSNQNTIIKTSDEHLMNGAKVVADNLIDKYTSAFYDYAYDTFTLRVEDPKGNNNAKIWNPYMIRFLHEHDIIIKYDYDLMTEIFVPQYYEGGYEHWFKDDVWMDSIYNKITRKQKLEVLDVLTVVDKKDSLTKWVKLPFHNSFEEIYLDSFANSYSKNYISDIPAEALYSLGSSIWNKFINIKTLDSKKIDSAKGNNVTYLEDKYLVELEYFSRNARDIWNNSKIGDKYYVYNNNSGNIDNVYSVVSVPGEVSPLPEEDLLQSNRYFKLIDNYHNTRSLGDSIMFFDQEMNITSVWAVLSDGRNRFLGRYDGNMFGGNSVQISDEVIGLIRDYYKGNKKINQELLDKLNLLNIRRDSAISYYLIPLVIYILKEFVDHIQR